MPTPFHLRVLRAELDARRVKNSRYSLRAFARDLGVDPSALSRILRLRDALAPALGADFVARLNLSPSMQRRFLESVLGERKRNERRKLARSLPAFRESDVDEPPRPGMLSQYTYERIADTCHQDLLKLSAFPGCPADLAWVGRQIGVTELRAKWIVAILLKTELLRREGGTLIRTEAALGSKREAERAIIRMERERALFETLRSSLGSAGVVFHSERISVRPGDLPQAEAMIRSFLRELKDRFDADGEGVDRCLSVQLFPVDPPPLEAGDPTPTGR